MDKGFKTPSISVTAEALLSYKTSSTNLTTNGLVSTIRYYLRKSAERARLTELRDPVQTVNLPTFLNLRPVLTRRLRYYAINKKRNEKL